MASERTEDGFEDYLKERADQFRMHPSDSVWAELNAKMHKPRRWPYVLGAAVIFSLGIGVGVLIQKSNEQPVIAAQSPAFKESFYRPAERLENELAAIGIANNPIGEEGSMIENFLLNNLVTQKKEIRQAGRPSERKPETASLILAYDRPASLASFTDTNIPAALNKAADFTRIITPAVQRNRPVGSARTKKEDDPTGTERASITTNILQTIDRIGKRTGIQFYVAPSFSYRRLVGQASKTSFNYSGFPYSANYGFPTDVNDAVVHKPAFGLEVGTMLTQNIGKRLRLKAGLQFNFNNYDIEAYSYMPEMAPFTAARQQGAGSSVSTLAYYRNANGFNKTWLRNSHFMVSIPVGFDATLFGNRRVKFNVASTIQPTYVLNNKSYLISTNLKNYAQEPSLYRNWNLNAGAEAYLSVDAGSYRWIAGPQVRYQLLSSYKEDYPIREHLVDYGFKIGIQKTLK